MPASPGSRPAQRGPASGEFAAVQIDVAPLPGERMCDAVHIAGDRGSATVYLESGAFIGIEADIDGIADIVTRLVDAGHVTSAELEAVVTLARAENVSVREMLVGLQLVDARVVREIVIQHARDHLIALAGMQGRRVSWVRESVAIDDEPPLPIEDLLGSDDLRKWRRVLLEAAPAGQADESRIALRRTAEVETATGPMVVTTLDISETGARLRAPTLIPIASRIVVRFALAGEKLELTARVVRFERAGENAPPAVVVLWTDLPPATEQSFTRLLASLY